MAASDATEFPIKGVAWRVTVPIYDSTGALFSGGLTGLAATISKDGGTAVSTTNTPTEIATNFGMVYLDLTSTEMNADTVAIKVTATNTDAKPTPIVRYPMNMSEPTGPPTWGMKLERVLAWSLLRLRNKETTTNAVITIYADDGTTVIGTMTRSDDSTTYTRGKVS